MPTCRSSRRTGLSSSPPGRPRRHRPSRRNRLSRRVSASPPDAIARTRKKWDGSRRTGPRPGASRPGAGVRAVTPPQGIARGVPWRSLAIASSVQGWTAGNGFVHRVSPRRETTRPRRGASSPPGFRRSLSRGDSSGCACRALSSRLDPLRNGAGSQDLCARHWRQCRPKRSRERAPGTRLPKRGPAAGERSARSSSRMTAYWPAGGAGWQPLSPRSRGDGLSCRAADRRVVRKMATSPRTGNRRSSGGNRLREVPAPRTRRFPPWRRSHGRGRVHRPETRRPANAG